MGCGTSQLVAASTAPASVPQHSSQQASHGPAAHSQTSGQAAGGCVVTQDATGPEALCNTEGQCKQSTCVTAGPATMPDSSSSATTQQTLQDHPANAAASSHPTTVIVSSLVPVQLLDGRSSNPPQCAFSHAAQQPVSDQLPVAVSPASTTLATAFPMTQQLDLPSEQLPEHNAEVLLEPAVATIAAMPATPSSASLTAVPCDMGPAPPAPATIPHDVSKDCEVNTAGLLLAAPQSPTDVTQRGISLAFLLLLSTRGVLPPALTIQQAVDQVVRPSSASFRCCLFDLVPTEHTGRPSYFISHTWSRPIQQLLQLLTAHFGVSDPSEPAAASAVIWLDIFAINQHPYEDRGCLGNDDVANLARVVAATDRTLLCLDEECVVLTRIWCLYEVWQTFLAKDTGGLRILMSSVDVQRLKQLFDGFDVRQAQATQPADRERILASISDSIGAVELNLRLRRTLVDSAREEATQLQAHQGGPEHQGSTAAHALQKAATMLQASGSYDEAAKQFQQAREAFVKQHGELHAAPLSAASGLAACLHDAGQHSQAVKLSAKVLRGYQELQGPSHPDALLALDQYARSLMQLDSQDRNALAAHRVALEGCTQELGSADARTLAVGTNAALCAEQRGFPAHAIQMHNEVLCRSNVQLGPGHRLTLDTKRHIARCLLVLSTGLEAATQLLTDVRTGMANTLGPGHPDTLQCTEDLAQLMDDQGMHTAAEALWDEAHQAVLAGWGPSHPRTLTHLHRLAQRHKDRGSYEQALALFERAADGRRAACGAKSQEAFSSSSGAGSCLLALGELHEAHAVLQSAFEGLLAIFHYGDNPELVACQKALAECCERLCKRVDGNNTQHELWAQQARSLRAMLPSNTPAGTSLELHWAAAASTGQKQGQESGSEDSGSEGAESQSYEHACSSDELDEGVGSHGNEWVDSQLADLVSDFPELADVDAGLHEKVKGNQERGKKGTAGALSKAHELKSGAEGDLVLAGSNLSVPSFEQALQGERLRFAQLWNRALPDQDKVYQARDAWQCGKLTTHEYQEIVHENTW